MLSSFMINIYSGQTLRMEPKIYEIVNDEQTVFYSHIRKLLRKKSKIKIHKKTWIRLKNGTLNNK